MALFLKHGCPGAAPFFAGRETMGSVEAAARCAITSRVVYVGNLSFATSEMAIYELFSRCGPIERIVMGLNRQTLTPCGFCFIIYMKRESLIDAMTTLDGTILDERVIKVEVDKGFYEGRQYGRGETGGQVRDEVRRNVDIERGGAPGELTQLPFTPIKYPEPPGGVPVPRSRAGAAGGRGGQARRGGRAYDRDRRSGGGGGGGGGGGYRGRDNAGGGAGHEREYDNRERGYGRGGDRENNGGRERGYERDVAAAPVVGMKRGRNTDAGAGAGSEGGVGHRSRDAEYDGAAAMGSARACMEPTSRDRYREGADTELDEFGRIRRPTDFDSHDDIKRRRLEEME